MARLLLVEDDDLVRAVLAEALVAAGHTVQEATDGLHAMEVFRAEPADIVILDLLMPGQEGIETMLMLRREQPELPVVAMSGNPTHSKLYLEMAAKLGANRVLAKPFSPSALVHVIDDVLAENPPSGTPA